MRGGTDGEESRGGRMRVEDRGGGGGAGAGAGGGGGGDKEVEGRGRSERRRGGGTDETGLMGGALSLREEETEPQLERSEEESRENSALNCHRSLQTEIGVSADVRCVS